MSRHLNLRSYMAGIAVPTIVLLVVIASFMVFRFAFHFSAPVERVIVFPMAISPNMWGLWNVLFVRFVRIRLPIGVWGAMLPLVLAPMGLAVSGLLDIAWMTRIRIIAIGLPPAAIVYYLVWKHVVGFLNQLLEID